MESFLNIVCLLIAVSSFAWWHQRLAKSRPSRGGRRKRFLELVTLACALALFLPSISITDDLHAKLAVMEDSSSRRKATSIATAHGPIQHDHFNSPPAILPRPAAPLAFGPSLENLSAANSFFSLSTFARITSDRAPPSL